jgi:DivIVA domain-containing protein
MELTPQTLHAVEFREARRGGYNTRDVDDFIERIAASVGHLNDRARDAHARADAAEARLADLQHEVDELRRRPPAVAAAPEVSETDETLRRTLVLAQRTADATIKEAKEEANRVLSEAREEAARTRAEAEDEARRGAAEARVAAQHEVETLLSNRDKLKSDLDVLTSRIDEQREQLQAGIDELQRVLDDPAALKPVAPVELAEVEAPAPALAPAEPLPALPTREPLAEREAANGRSPVDVGSPFGPGAQVAALQEPPPAEFGPPTQPVPFAVSGDGRAPWLPSELRGPDDEPLGPPPAPPGGNGSPGPNGGPAVSYDPDNRPSEWGKAVFDPDKAEGDASRFGRRR